MKVRGLIPWAAVLSALLLPPATSALPDASPLAPGAYRCASYNVSGGGGSCRNMAPLTLNADGSYQLSSTRGRWSVRDGDLILSESTLWGPGKILGPDTVRFEYDYRGWRHAVTWVCQECAVGAPPPVGEPQAERAPASKGSYVGVSLILEFDQAIGGVSAFVIVPAEHARGYTHNAPLPRGAVQGLAWETGAATVTLGSNRDNKLISGARYVVFLSWPRETIPVAILDLPPVTGDYAAALPATLDGARVLEKIGP